MSRGRPRSFDLDEAVQTAMDLFWAKGYEGATIPDLTAAIGINRPSLYSAFGSKENLFRLALDRYRQDPASYVNRALAKPTAYEVFESLLGGVIDLVTDPKRPGGCLFVCGANALGVRCGDISGELASRRIAGEKDIRKRFEAAKKDGDLSADSDPKSLAKLAATLMWGISIQASNGASRTDLKRLAVLTLDSVKSHFRPDHNCR